jgi:alkanesulfonate monooxygenase SsuD/methylene tetrahydromethanopterin reductase-like flavin-dependent oxidoreductase (luciferase family)
MPDYGHELAFGTFITPQAARPADAVALARLAEQVGLDLASFQDHPYQPRFLDTWTLLTWVAAETELLRIATNVLNVPLRLPAMVARAAASLDLLSVGRFELGLGAGAFWDGIAAMGGRRLRPGQSVAALEETIDIIRMLWDVHEPGPAHYEGRYHRLEGAGRGPAPFHDVGIWIGAYKPRMLDLVGRKGDGWLPSESYLEPGDLSAGNAAIDAAARRAGRDPASIRRLLNVAPHSVAPSRWAQELAGLALEEGISTFFLMGDDPAMIQTFAGEVAPAVRELVAQARLGSPVPAQPEPEEHGLGVTPTQDDGTRLRTVTAWDEATRPRREPADGLAYTARGRLVAQHLIDVHDMLRTELSELREVLTRVREGSMSAAEARSALHDMALRQNDWTLGAFCARYCAVVAQHHGLEDDSIFPHLVRSEPELAPVIDRLVDEHLVIGDAIQQVDHALVRHITSGDFAPIQEALDLLTDALLSHLSYEEQELVEPLARLGFYPGQV